MTILLGSVWKITIITTVKLTLFLVLSVCAQFFSLNRKPNVCDELRIPKLWLVCLLFDYKIKLYLAPINIVLSYFQIKVALEVTSYPVN